MHSPRPLISRGRSISPGGAARVWLYLADGPRGRSPFVRWRRCSVQLCSNPIDNGLALCATVACPAIAVPAPSGNSARRVLKDLSDTQPTHAHDAIGRTGALSFGGRVECECPMDPEGQLKFEVATELRTYDNSTSGDPWFRLGSPQATVRALRDACELRVEVLRDFGEQVCFKPIILWIDDSARVFGHRGDRSDGTVRSECMSRDACLEKFSKDLSGFLHLGNAVPVGVKWDFSTFASMQSGRSLPCVKRLPDGRCITLATVKATVPNVELWLMDTGSGVDIVGRKDVSRLGHKIRPHTDGTQLYTVNGPTTVEEEVEFYIRELKHKTTALVLPDSPSLLSLGYRCQALGCRFTWEPYSTEPVLDLPCGRSVVMESHGYIPYLRVSRGADCFNHFPNSAVGLPSRTPTLRESQARQQMSSLNNIMAILADVNSIPPLKSAPAPAAGDGSGEGITGGEDVPPPPKPEGARVKRIGRDIPLEHMLDHLPMLPHCKECQMGRLRAKVRTSLTRLRMISPQTLVMRSLPITS